MRDVFEEALERLDLESVCRDHNSEFNHSGKASCPYPDHEDKDPSFSLHPSKTYAYCFGCGRGGNAIQIEYELGNYPNNFEVLKSLNERYHLGLKYDGYDSVKANEYDYTFKLLDWYCKQTNNALLQNKQALKWLETEKGITLEIIKEYKIGYVRNGWLRDKVKDKSKEIALKLVLLKEKDGRVFDNFWNRLIFPVWNYGRIVNIWTREWPDREGSNSKWLGLETGEFTPCKPIAFVEHLKCDKCAITESIPDALAFIQVGIPAVALLGKDVSQANIRYFEKAKAKLYLALDPDEAGRKTSYELAREYHGYIVDLEHDKDSDQILAEYGIDEFKAIVKTGLNEATYYLDAVIENEDKIEALRAIAKVKFESDKDAWIKKLSDKHRIGKRALQNDLKTICKEAQAKFEDQEQPYDPLSEYTEDEIGQARILLKDPELLNKIVGQVGRNGYIGETTNKTVLVLSFTSRLFDEAISNVVKGESSSGKSALVKAVLRVFPESVYREFTRITAQALYYLKNLDLSHKILVIFESQGSEKADYSLRSVISERELRLLVTAKNEKIGILESKEIVIPAKGVSYIETTTKPKLNPENQTRLFDLYINESSEQSRKILQSKKTPINKEVIDNENRPYQALQLLLRPYEVYIPYIGILADTFPVDKVRCRRDFPRFENLIKANCLLHQEQRETIEIGGKCYLVATIEDYNTAYQLAGVVLSQTLKEITPRQEKILQVAKKELKENWFSRGELATKGGFTNNTTFKDDVYHLRDAGYLEHNGETGRNSKYRIVSIPQGILKLVPPEQLEEQLKKISSEMSDPMSDMPNSESSQDVSFNLLDMSDNWPNAQKGEETDNGAEIGHVRKKERNYPELFDNDSIGHSDGENTEKIFSKGDEMAKEKTGLCTGCWKIRIACICN